MTIYYVDASFHGSDSNSGSQALPWKTLSHANNTVTGGDEVVVLPGSYAEQVVLKSSNVVWRAAGLGVLMPVGSYSTAFIVTDLTGVTIEGFDISGATNYGIQVQGGGGHTIRCNKVSGCTSGGIRLQPLSPQLFTPQDGGAGGTLPAGTHYYAVTAIIGGEETLPSFILGVTIPASHTVFLEWSKIPSASSFNIYGRTQTGPTLITNVTNSFGGGFPNWTDDGSLSPDGTTTLPITTNVNLTQCIVEGNEVFGNSSHGIYLFGAQNVLVRGNHCHHNGFHGIALFNASNSNTVEFNVCHDNSHGDRIANGIQCDNFGVGTPGSTNNLIQCNRVFRNEDSGISIYNGSHNCVVRRNISYLNGDHGLDNLDSQNCHFINNTVYGNVTSGINSEGASGGIRMYGNIAMDNGVYSPRASGNYRVDPTAVADAQLDYNLTYLTVPAAEQPPIVDTFNYEMVWGSIKYDDLAAFRAGVPDQMIHGASGDPVFANPEYGDYHLGSGSRAIHLASASVPNYLNTDYYGILSGTLPDAGAVE